MVRNKRQAQVIHAKRRAFERYGLNLTVSDLKEFVRQIQKREAAYIGRATNRITLFTVKHKGMELPVAYDKLRNTIASVLPVNPSLADIADDLEDH